MRKFDDSAQLLLLAAFAIGFTLVITTIMLNNVIYASNMASESTTDISSYDISNVAQMTDEATKAAYNNNSKAEFTEYMNSYANEVTAMYAFRGLSLSFDNSSLVDPYFTKSGLYGGESDWIVVKNVNRTDEFTIELNDTSKLGNASNAYEVQVINQSGTTWLMKVYNDSVNINITVNNNTHQEPLYAYMRLNITGKEIDGDTYDFKFDTSTTTDPYKIKFVNSSNAMGYYTISGVLDDDEQTSFVEKRSWVTNATISLSSNNNKINLSIPVTVP
ncbi:hypothetical protein LI82_09665 [Methanococcoides methylutens]|uniref:Uncharacterized protein n=1 Tax=Methanococcoides methylutens TaxID=2226 RepID=A0A099SYL0_METMT|nr:hypothetical protein [Methanococcoides methylutens]KGK98005.1 hypothetical protein LI82_09665 [Methanococcoides methylutens]